MLCDVQSCSGCSACKSVCPKNAIEMIENDEGFLNPVIDENKCIKCSRCNVVCPSLHPPKKNDVPTVYAATHRNKEVLTNSSSGGVFFALAQKIIEEGGVVVGARYNEEFKVVHDYTLDVEGLRQFQKSKYSQSDIGKMYIYTKRFLNEGKTVLFSGTPCQIAGLRNYLGPIKRGELITLDLLCHGVGSPGLFREHIEYLENKNKSKLTYFCFRNKEDIKPGVVRKKPTIAYAFEDGKKKVMPFNLDRYSNGFNRCLLLRTSCARCKFSSAARVSDISLGDFWGLGRDTPSNISTNDGVSLVLLNSSIGSSLFANCMDNFDIEERTLEEAKKGNRTLYEPSRENFRRQRFFSCYKKTGYCVSTSLYTVSVLYKLKYYLKSYFLATK